MLLFQDSEHDLEFPFSVIGDEPVTVTALETSCGCTDARIVVGDEEHLTQVTLEPGTTGKVAAVFKTQNFQGHKSSSILIRGNAKDMPLELGIKTFIHPVFRLSPAEARFGQLTSGPREQAPSTSMRVIAAEPFEILSWISTPAGIRVEELPDKTRTLEDGRQERWFQVTLLEDIPVGRLYQTAIAETTLKRNLEFVIQAHVVGPVSYAPESRVSFGMVGVGQALTRRVNVRARAEGRDIAPPQVELVGADVFTTELVEKEPGRSYVIKIHLSPDAQAGQHRGQLQIRFPEGSSLDPQDLQVSAIIRDRS